MCSKPALLALLLAAATAGARAQADPFASLAFLQGTWDAETIEANGIPHLTGRYSFLPELKGHILARHSTTDAGCHAPTTLDCDHSDLLYLYPGGGSGTPLQAIYFDNEGHTIHYNVSTPTPTSVVFLSQPGPGPQFRLTYQLQGSRLRGSFAIEPPGANAWHTYLEWSGERR